MCLPYLNPITPLITTPKPSRTPKGTLLKPYNPTYNIDLKGLRKGSQSSQSLQNPLTKEYTLIHIEDPVII